ncbi:MAG TPA: preprotein translocase subunit SecE [Gammaproteobacteria bacterium]|nr:preprotein translocase subunit SecE [Gammaproteobacteria bacterium]
MADKVKLGTAVLILALAVGAFYHFSEQMLLFRVLGLLVALGLSAAVAVQSQQGASALDFSRSALIEVRKVVWPSRKETVQTTGIVLVMVVLMGLILWLFDTFLLWAVRLLTGQGS